jgi:pimeloyl-ACP methyl ester carboxylesterase
VNNQLFDPSSIEFFYPNGILPAQIPNTHNPIILEAQEDDKNLNQYRQCILDEHPANDLRTWAYGDHGSENIVGFDESIRYVLELLNEHGPFIGIIGFSMGAALAAITASLLEPDRRVKNSHFKVSVS